MNNRPSCSEVVRTALDIGENMVMCGAEINRVEDTVERICRAYGYSDVEVFSITSLIIVTANSASDNPITQTRRIYSNSTALGKLEKLNALSREICETLPSIGYVKEKMTDILKDKRKLHFSVALGYILTCPAFAMFFGGTLLDALASIPIAAVLFLADALVKRKGSNKLLYTFVASLAAGSLAMLFVKLGFGDHADKIMIGNIMVLIPGLAFTNSLREMLCGDTMSGFMRFLEALLISLAIALGFAVPIVIGGGVSL